MATTVLARSRPEDVQPLPGNVLNIYIDPNGNLKVKDVFGKSQDVSDFIQTAPYVPPTYTSGSVLFAGSDGAPTQDNANFFYSSANKRLGIGTSSPSAMIHITGSASATVFQAQNTLNTFFTKIVNRDPSDNSAYFQINGASIQASAPILLLSTSSLNRFSLRMDGFIAFQGGSFMGDNAAGGTYGNALKISNGPSSGGVILGFANSIAFGGGDIPQVTVGLNNSYSGTGAPNNRMTMMQFEGTYNQTNGTNQSIAIRIVPTLTSITGSYIGVDFDPAITTVSALYGFRIRPTSTQNAVSYSSAPTSKIHIGAVSTSAGSSQIKFDMTGSLMTSPEVGAVEVVGSHFYFTNDAGTRLQMDPELDGTPDTNQTGNGWYTRSFVAATSITIMQLLYLNSSSKWALANASATSTSVGMLAIAAAAGTTDVALRVILPGSYVRNDSWNWTPGQELYVDTTNGAITASAPSTSGQVVRHIGWATDADTIYFFPTFYTIVP
jgi:hypothetical protein